MKPRIEIVKSAVWRKTPGVSQLARRAIAASLAATATTIADGAEVGVRFVDDATVRAINARWRGLDKSTNVLSFPAAPPDRVSTTPMLGDILLAFETVAREAAEESKSLADHTAHLVTHGFLHLLGFDHQDAAEAERMEALETMILARLGIADPYAATDAVDVCA
jgi:probable rRNA maturation factor